jgi:long-chain acyl-CoA synthetase
MVQMKINDTNVIKRLLYKLCLPIGYKIADFKLEQRKKPTLFWQFLYMIADWVCFRPIRDHLGLQKVRTGITGGSSLGPDIFRWFRAIGINIKEGYGLTEINPVAIHGDIVKAGTVGPPVPGVTVRISNEGEILVSSDAKFQGYYKQPEEAAKMVVDGWVKTGDAGTFDEDGHLIILDRVKDMLLLKEGQKFSPTYIENRLKFSPYVKDVMVIGGEEREYIFAIINIDFDNVGRWAERNKIPYTTYVDLSQKTEVYDLIQRDVERVNKTLPSGARVKKYALLHKEFDPDEGELTRTRKLRRSFLEDRYGNLINAAYEGQAKVTTEAQVTYRDGRRGSVTTDINIRTLE